MGLSCYLVAGSLFAATPGPTITILSPADGKTVWSTGTTQFPIRIVFKAWDSDGVGASTFKLSVDGGVFNDIDTDPALYGAFSDTYYFDWTPTAGSHTIQIQGSDGANLGNSRKVTIKVKVQTTFPSYSTFPGDGTLLVRDNDNTICMACHAIKSHSSADIGSTKYGNWERICRDCHTPHNTKNIFLLQSSFKVYTGSYNGTTRLNQTYAYNKKIDFRNLSGASAYGLVSKSGPTRRGPCEGCHTRTSNADGTARWRNNTSLPDTEGVQFIDNLPKHNSGQTCTNCHKHSEGFAGKESKGNQVCSGCHAGLFTVMSTGNNLFHHYMNNSRVDTLASGSKYPVTTSIMGISYGNANRRCLMCHVDHDIFASSTSTQKRAGNLRISIRALPSYNTAQRTDFVNQTSTSQGIWGGLCMSCHRKSQMKYTTMLGKDGSKQTPIIPFPGGTPYDYTQTAHGSFTVPATFKTDSSKFKANCMKCHNDALKKTKQAGTGYNAFGTKTSSFGTHGSPIRRLQSLMGDSYDVGIANGTAPFATLSTIYDPTKTWTAGEWEGSPVSITFGKGANQGRTIRWNTTNRLGLDKPWDVNIDGTSKYNIGDPIEEGLCFHCHSKNTTFNPYTARDYYGKRGFDNDKAKKMHQVFTDGWPVPPLVGKAGTVSSTVITPTPAPGWTASQYVGYLLVVKSGRAQGRSQMVTANTATTVTIRRSIRNFAANDKFVIQKNPYRHQIDAYVGKHRTDEYFGAENGPTKTPAGWYGNDQHVGCTDCHNPHGARPQGITNGYADTTYTTASSITDTSKTGPNAWPTNRWKGYVVKVLDNNYTSLVGQMRIIQSNTGNRLQLAGIFLAGNNTAKAPKGSHYVVESVGKPPKTVTGNDDEGNDINNANYGIWGVDVNFTNITAAPITPADISGKKSNPINKNPIFTKMAVVQKVYQICFKCHSDYGWGNNGPRIEIPDSLGTSSGSFDNGTSTNIAREFNPNNLSHHAIVAPGNNQPILPNYGNAAVSSYYNAAWPYYKTATAADTLTIDASGNATLANVAKLPSTVIPGWYVWVGTAVSSDIPNNNTTTAYAGTATSGWFQIASITDDQHFKVATTGVTLPVAATQYWGISAGLGNNFVPPYGPWSVISCADCHGSDRDDPSGPHASAKMWIRRDLDNKISFDWMNASGAIVRINYYTMGFNMGTGSSSDAPNICINCHRTDVYGQNGRIGGTSAAIADMARVSHMDLRSADDNIDSLTTTYGIICMGCHGGDALGAIHGSNEGRGASGSGTSYRGRRMMNGAAWDGYTRGATSVTCFNNRANNSVTSCNEGSSSNISTNYSYIGGADGRTVP